MNLIKLSPNIINVSESLEAHSKVSKRIISGVTGAALVLFVLFFNGSFPIILNLFIAAIAAFAINELFSVMNISKMFVITLPSLVFVPLFVLFKDNVGSELIWYLYTLWMLSAMILNSKLELRDVFVTYAMSMMISTCLSKVIELRDFGGEYGGFLVLLGLGVAWISDTGAYFFGKYLGRRKLCPDVSPKKTIEGFFGGMITCTVSLILISLIFNNFVFPSKHQINYLMIIFLGISGSLIAALGDLCFSIIKRRCNVKDFGNIMPGHGGILDRFDSVIFTVPYVYILVRLIPIIS